MSSLIFACAFTVLLGQLFFQCGLSGQDGIDLVVKILDHDLRFEVDLIIVLCTAAVLFLLPVLAHHDERRLNGRHAREHQIEQDEGVRVERREFLRNGAALAIVLSSRLPA